MSQSNGKFISYINFLKQSRKVNASPRIWKQADIEKHMQESLASPEMGEGRGAVSLVNPDNESGLGITSNINALVQVLAPNEHNNPHKHSNFAFFIVFEGEGYSIIDEQKIEWSKGDVFLAPGWLAHEHCNTSATERAVLYTVQNVPEITGLNSWFLEEPLGSGAKHIVQGASDKDILPEK